MILKLSTRAAALAVTLVAAMALTGSAKATTPGFEGKWISSALEPQGKMFASRTFSFKGNAWSVIYRTFADAEGKVPLFTLAVDGVYVLGASSKSVADAVEGNFPALHRRIAAEGSQGVEMFAAMGCRLVAGVAKDLTSEPCGFVPSLMSAMGEYDLVAIKDGKLFFGDRGGDLSKTRPTALTPYPLVKH